MRFKLFGITWDFAIVVAAAWSFVGVAIIALTFAIPSMSVWQMVVYAITTVIYLATAEHVSKKLTPPEPPQDIEP